MSTIFTSKEELQKELFNNLTQEVLERINREFIIEKENYLREINNSFKENAKKFLELKSANEAIVQNQESKLEVINLKIESLFDDIQKTKNSQEKIPSLLKNQDNIYDDIFKLNSKLSTLQYDVTINHSKFDKFLLANLLLPGLLGKECKYETLADFIKSCIENLSTLNTFKDKMSNDFYNFKQLSENK